jgi:hypothetical protein
MAQLRGKGDKVKTKPKQKSNVLLIILILAVSLGVGIIGSYAATLVKTSQAWIIMCVIAMAVIDGYLVGMFKRR